MRELLPDLRVAWRALRRNRAFTIAAVLCLTLGIAATTAVFSVVNAVVLRPLPYREPGQLARLHTEFPNFPNGGLRRFWTSPPEFIELRRDLKQWATLDAWQITGMNIAGGAQPVRATVAMVSGTLLESLGVSPLLGRPLGPADDAFGAPRAVVLSFALWQSAFGGDRGVLGREILLDGNKATVAGVMPARFEFPPGEVDPPLLWIALQLNPANPGGRGNHRLHLLGRLRAGVSLEQARQELARLVEVYGAGAGGSGPHRLHPENHPLVAYPLGDEVVGNVRPALFVMLAAVGFVLLISCGNVANLLLARAQARQREIAVRRALGASTGTLVRQFVIEGLLLAVLGCASGMLLAFGALRLILAAGAGAIPRAAEIGMDRDVLLVAVALCAATGVFFGLSPLVQVMLDRLNDVLKAAGARTSASREAHLLRNSLVVSQSALALILLIGAGLMLQAFWRLQAIDAGIRTHNVLTMRIALPPALYREAAEVRGFWERLQQQAAALPGVEAASIVTGLAPIRPVNANDTQIEGFVPQPGGPIQNIDYYQACGHDYFSMLGIRLLEGRFFTAGDAAGAPPVVVINETFARIYYPGQSPLGRRVRPSFKGDWLTIVGVVSDVRNAGLERPAGTELYFSFAQTEGLFRAPYLLLRSKQDRRALVQAVRSTVAALDPALPISLIREYDDVLRAAKARPRFLTLLLSLFSALALVLAALGIYSVMSYTVAQRTGEFGLRMALGAQRADVLRLVLRQGLLLAAAGALLGCAGAFGLHRLLRGNVYGIDTLDPLAVASMAAVLFASTLAACFWPARRATRVDPLDALRYE